MTRTLLLYFLSIRGLCGTRLGPDAPEFDIMDSEAQTPGRNV